MLFVILVGVIFGIICMNMAESRGRNGALGFIGGAFFGILAVIYYFTIPKK